MEIILWLEDYQRLMLRGENTKLSPFPHRTTIPHLHHLRGKRVVWNRHPCLPEISPNEPTHPVILRQLESNLVGLPGCGMPPGSTEYDIEFLHEKTAEDMLRSHLHLCGIIPLSFVFLLREAELERIEWIVVDEQTLASLGVENLPGRGSCCTAATIGLSSVDDRLIYYIPLLLSQYRQVSTTFWSKPPCSLFLRITHSRSPGFSLATCSQVFP